MKLVKRKLLFENETGSERLGAVQVWYGEHETKPGLKMSRVLGHYEAEGRGLISGEPEFSCIICPKPGSLNVNDGATVQARVCDATRGQPPICCLAARCFTCALRASENIISQSVSPLPRFADTPPTRICVLCHWCRLQVVLLATQGLWEVCSDDDVLKMIRNLRQPAEEQEGKAATVYVDAQAISQALQARRLTHVRTSTVLMRESFPETNHDMPPPKERWNEGATWLDINMPARVNGGHHTQAGQGHHQVGGAVDGPRYRGAGVLSRFVRPPAPLMPRTPTVQVYNAARPNGSFGRAVLRRKHFCARNSNC